MFLDNRLPGEPKVDAYQVEYELGQPSAYANRFVTRHRARGLMAFTDGRVKAERGSSVVTNGLAIMPQHSIIWTANPLANPNVN